MKRSLVVIALMVLAAAGGAAAQPPARQRAQLEQQFRERTAQLIRKRLGLSERQMEQLEVVNRRYAPQMNQLAMQERETRRQLRQEMVADTAADQRRVSELLDATIRIQKQRIALIEAEQKDLATFLTPVQRARYIALQMQFRKRADELSRRSPGRRVPRGMQRP